MNNQLKNHLNNPDINWQYIAIICFLSLLMVGGLLVYQLKQQDIEIPIIEVPEKIDEFAGWKTYRSDEYGFEVRYPREWQVDKKITEWQSAPPTIFISFESNIGCNVGISIIQNPENLSAREYRNNWCEKQGIAEYSPAQAFCESRDEWKTVYTGGEKGLQYIFSDATASLITAVSGNGLFFEISRQHIDFPEYNGSCSLEYKQIYDQILSTFRFLD